RCCCPADPRSPAPVGCVCSATVGGVACAIFLTVPGWSPGPRWCCWARRQRWPVPAAPALPWSRGGNTVTSHGLGHVGGEPAFSWFQVLFASVRGRVVPAVTGGGPPGWRVSHHAIRHGSRDRAGEKGKPGETTYAAGLLGPAAVCRAGGEPARAGHG